MKASCFDNSHKISAKDELQFVVLEWITVCSTSTLSKILHPHTAATAKICTNICHQIIQTLCHPVHSYHSGSLTNILGQEWSFNGGLWAVNCLRRWQWGSCSSSRWLHQFSDTDWRCISIHSFSLSSVRVSRCSRMATVYKTRTEQSWDWLKVTLPTWTRLKKTKKNKVTLRWCMNL